MPGADDEVIHPRWLTWVAENLARGTGSAELVEALIGEGVSEGLAREAVRQLEGSPAMAAARALWWRVQALEQVVRLRRVHRQDGEVERRGMPGAEEFLAR